MNNQVFVPVTDDIIYNHPELIEGPLVPYFAGMECQNWLSIEINPDESEPTDATPVAVQEQDIRAARAKSNIRLAYSA